MRRPHSAVMHNAAFRHFGVDARYELLELAPGDLDHFFAQVRGDDWLGFQITAPYKQEAFRRCDVIEPQAARIGAVNSVIRNADGSLTGFNTDAPGFVDAVSGDLGRGFTGARVCVAGAGGAARAVAAASVDAGAGSVVVGARSVPSAAGLAHQLGGGIVSAVGLGTDFDAHLATADLAVNATTVGMTSPGTAFDPVHLEPDRAAVFDLVYIPPVTELLTACRERNIPATNGLSMLVSQAAIAFTRWTGIENPAPVMRKALSSVLGT